MKQLYSPDNALSVAGLTDYIQNLLEGDRLLQKIWVTGEVSSTNNHAAGIFFTLSEPDGSAAINCVVWKSLRSRLVEQPKRGEQFLVLASIRLYPKRGDYQLNVFQVLPVGEGLQALQLQQLRSRLQAEGLLDSQRKRPLPPFPSTIAVVTSPTAAAWGDVQRTLTQRYSGIKVLFSPAIVQGERAASSIVRAIKRVNGDGRAEVLILARGGGSVEDLSCFNEERVVRAIASSEIPVVTGIGHERDESLADLVADVTAHTPTAAAEMAVPAFARLYEQHLQRKRRLRECLQERSIEESEYLALLRRRISALPNTSRTLQQAEAKCQLFKQKLVALDPAAVLQRGYAVVRNSEGKIGREAVDFNPEEEITIQLSQGVVKAKIIEINE